MSKLNRPGIRTGGLCGGKMPSEYVAGIDWYCDGEASRKRARHRRVIVLSIRWHSCEKAAPGAATPWWFPKASFEEVGPDGAPLGRGIADCDRCAFARSISASKLTREMESAYVEHARRIDRRNVATLLVS